MRRLALALLLVCSPAVAQTTVGSWQELAAIVNRQAREIRDLQAKVDMLRNDYQAAREEIAVLRKLDEDTVNDLWLGFREHNATLKWALFHLCDANAKLAALPWFTPYSIAPHTCPTEPGPVPTFIVPPAP